MIRLLYLTVLFYLSYRLISRFWVVKDRTEVIDVEWESEVNDAADTPYGAESGKSWTREKEARFACMDLFEVH